MKNKPAKGGVRKPYAKPAVTVVSDRKLLEVLGPAQGYGQNTMPLDSEWTRGS